MENQKVILISGGSRGIGQGIVEDLIEKGYIVATFSRSETAFIKRSQHQDSQQERFYWEAVDAKDYETLKGFVFRVYRKYGRIDALINNAGANLDQLLASTKDEEIDDILLLNLKSVLQLSRLVSRIMLRQQEGLIINISSVIGLRGFKGTSVYGATKAALDGLTRSLGRELGSRGIRVNGVAPGFLETDMTHGMTESKKNQVLRRTPLQRLGKVNDIIGLIRFLITPEASFITGQTIVVDGGLTC